MPTNNPTNYPTTDSVYIVTIKMALNSNNKNNNNARSLTTLSNLQIIEIIQQTVIDYIGTTNVEIIGLILDETSLNAQLYINVFACVLCFIFLLFFFAQFRNLAHTTHCTKFQSINIRKYRIEIKNSPKPIEEIDNNALKSLIYDALIKAGAIDSQNAISRLYTLFCFLRKQL